MIDKNIEETDAVRPFILEGTTDFKKAARFAAGTPTDKDIAGDGQNRYLANSQQIVTIDDEEQSEREAGVTRVFMTRGSTMYVPLTFEGLKGIFEENGYRVYSLADQAKKPKGPAPR